MASGVKCCRCASVGLCLRCSCVVTGRPYLDCYLSRKDRYYNIETQECNKPSNDEDKVEHEFDDNQHTRQCDMSMESDLLYSVSESFSGVSISESENLLPPFDQTTNANFSLGDQDHLTVTRQFNNIYGNVVHWRPHLFKILSGNVGKMFVSEIAQLYLAFASGSGLESVESCVCDAKAVTSES